MGRHFKDALRDKQSLNFASDATADRPRWRLQAMWPYATLTGSPPVGKQERAERDKVGSGVIGRDVKVTLSSGDIGNMASRGTTAGKKEFNLMEEHRQRKAFWEICCSLPVTVWPWGIFSAGIQNSSLNQRLRNGIKGRSHEGDNPLVSLLLSSVNNESGSRWGSEEEFIEISGR